MPEAKRNWFKDITPDVLAGMGVKQKLPPGSVGMGEGTPLPGLPVDTGGTDMLELAERMKAREK